MKLSLKNEDVTKVHTLGIGDQLVISSGFKASMSKAIDDTKVIIVKLIKVTFILLARADSPIDTICSSPLSPLFASYICGMAGIIFKIVSTFSL